MESVGGLDLVDCWLEVCVGAEIKGVASGVEAGREGREEFVEDEEESLFGGISEIGTELLGKDEVGEVSEVLEVLGIVGEVILFFFSDFFDRNFVK